MVSTELDQQVGAQSGWSLRYEQLSGGPFQGRVHRVALPGLTLLREDIGPSVRQRGRLSDEVYGLAMPLHALDGLIFNGQRLPGPAIMCGKGDDIDMVTPEHFTMLAVVADRGLLNPLWERMYQRPLATWLDKQLVIPIAPEKSKVLGELHLAALTQADHLARRSSDEQALRQLRDEILIEWIEALPEQVDLRELPSVERRKRLVDQACELMLAHSDEPLSVLDICLRVGTSRRKLNYCFQDVLGTTPVKYLRSLRLYGVRSALRAANASTRVQDVAAHWGFWHLSQFGQDYRRLFGELPSVTLRRSLTGAGQSDAASR